ncbi:MAG: helix-hairpin-helix domain-containing protein [Tyzzerella sp.]|nr:helix-hairpin-helix domain-containing protein [Tyzzerella sp.]
MRRKIKIIFVVAFIMFCLAACKEEGTELTLLEDAVAEEEEAEAANPESIFVYVCGAVNCEGVYELPAGSRGYEAIDKAGGFRSDAATSQINQAEILQDEATLYVPTVYEIAESQAEDDGKVNLNTAAKEELMTLPGVGEAKALSIISYREEQGGFKTIEDIMQISGIKEGLFNKIKDYIKI